MIPPIHITLMVLLVFQNATQSKDCARSQPTAWALEDVIGNVKSLSLDEIHYSYTDPRRELKRRVLFDNSGAYVEIEEPDMLPRLSKGDFRPLNIYDANCRVVERRESYVSDHLVKTIFRYDEWGRQIESSGLDEQGRLVYREISVYDAAGKVLETIETIRVHPEHFMPMRFDVYRNTRSEFRYEQNGRQVTELSYDFAGNYYSKVIKLFDEQGRQLEETNYDKLDQPIEYKLWAYSPDQRLAWKEEYRSFSYPSFSDRKLAPTTIQTRVGGFQTGSRFVYTYDARGNWVEEREFNIKENQGKRSLSLDAIIYRTIAYFASS